MFNNTISRFLINITTNLDYCLKSIFNSPVAFSPLMEHENLSFGNDILCTLQLRTGKRIFEIYIYSYGFDDEEKEKTVKHIKDNLYSINVVLNSVFKCNFKIELRKSVNNGLIPKKSIRIDLSINIENNDLYLTQLFPIDFLQLFSGKIKSFNIDLIEREIINFLYNPINLFPDLKIFFETLNEHEIQKLFHYLRKNNFLTPYQISLMLLSFPQHGTLIKNNLSANVIIEVNGIMKDVHFDKRDLVGGIYSIEESIYMSIKNDNLSFCTFIAEAKRSLKMFLDCQAIIKKSFTEWIEDMNSSGQLFYVLSSMKEDDIAKAISGNPGIYYSVFSRYLSKKKLEELLALLENRNVSISERIESQNLFISKYKKIKVKKLNVSHELFPILLTKIDKDEIVYLLVGVGWFILSTALKSMNIKKVMNLIERLPLGAKYLIIDVLQGIVNPNIIHDEMQVNKARLACVNELFFLYEDGIIDLLN